MILSNICVHSPLDRTFAMEGMVMAPALEASASGGLAPVERIRTRFIETWLWSLEKVG